MDELLKEILSRDKTLLTRREDLLKILDEKVPNNLRRTYAAVRKALTLNAGEILYLNDLSPTEKQEKIRRLLKESGMQDKRIDDVINIFVNALDLNAQPAEDIDIKATPTAEISAKKVNLKKVENPAPPTIQEIQNVPAQKAISAQEVFLRAQQQKIAAQNQKTVEEERERIIEETSRRFSEENYTNSFLPQNHLDEIFTTEGRLNRWRFFTKNLKLLALAFVGGIVSGITGFFGGLIILAAAIGGILITVRRLHDLNKSGWYIVLTFIPYVDIVFALYLLFVPGTVGDNKYGRDPLY